MSETENVTSLVASSKPSFLSKVDYKETIQGLDEHVIVPRAKIIQKSARKELLDKYRIGDMLLTPNNELISEFPYENGRAKGSTGSPVKLNILFYYNEFFKMNPMEATQANKELRMLEERTYDENSETAKKARNRETVALKTPDGRDLQVNGKPMIARYMETLNFIVCLTGDHPINFPFVLSCGRGEFPAGKRILTLVKQRAMADQAPIFAFNFNGVVAYRPGTGKGDWYGFDVTNVPNPNDRYVSEERFNWLAETAKNFRDLHKSNRLQAAEDDGYQEGIDPVNPAVEVPGERTM